MWRFFSLAASTLVFLLVLAWFSIHLATAIRSASQSVVGFIDSKVKQEQTEYHATAKEILIDVEKNAWLIEEGIASIEQNGSLTRDEKIQLNSELKSLEENSILLKRNFESYFDDLTIQAYPRSSSEITSFIYETGNCSIALDRFVRTFEPLLFESSYLRPDQTALILENYYDLIWYLGFFGMIERT